jgi:hypothetical protein
MGKIWWFGKLHRLCGSGCGDGSIRNFALNTKLAQTVPGPPYEGHSRADQKSGTFAKISTLEDHGVQPESSPVLHPSFIMSIYSLGNTSPTTDPSA